MQRGEDVVLLMANVLLKSNFKCTLYQVQLDAMDIAGDNQLNVEHDMIKQRLSPLGRPIGKAGVEIIGEVRVRG